VPAKSRGFYSSRWELGGEGKRRRGAGGGARAFADAAVSWKVDPNRWLLFLSGK
jgi:hypothetical protein